jgi:hypothetical protein
MIEDLRRLPDGGFAILNRGTQEVRLFNREGLFETSFGREGDGPGEFRDPVGIQLHGSDSIVVFDWGLRRVSLFDQAGAHGRTVPLVPPPRNPTGRFGILVGTSGFVIATEHVQRIRSKQLVELPLRLLTYSPDGVLQDTIATLQNVRRGLVSSEARLVKRPLFGHRAAVTISSGGWIYASWSGEPSVAVLDGLGTAQRVVRWEAPDRIITETDVAAQQAFELERAPSEMIRRMTREGHKALPVETEFPAMVDLRVDDRGHLWVRRYPRPLEDVESWLRFDETGEFVCALDLPKGLRVLEFWSNEVTGIVKDDFDIEYVEVRRIDAAIQRR